MQKSEPFLRELPEEFVSDRNGWSFHNGQVWPYWLTLSAVTSYSETVTWPLGVRQRFMWGSGGVSDEAGGRRGREKGGVFCNVRLASRAGKRQLAHLAKCRFSPLAQCEGCWMAEDVSCCVGRC